MGRCFKYLLVLLGLSVMIVAAMFCMYEHTDQNRGECHFAFTVTNGFGSVQAPIVAKMAERARTMAPAGAMFVIDGEGVEVRCRGALTGDFDTVAVSCLILRTLSEELKKQNEKRGRVVTARSRSALEKARLRYEESVNAAQVRHSENEAEVGFLRKSYEQAQAEFASSVALEAKYRDHLVVLESPHLAE